jgi:DNA-binding PadR family transcriptional regulator
MDGPTDIRYELTDRGRRYLDLRIQAEELEADIYLSDANDATKSQMRAKLFNLEEEAHRLLHEP